MYFCRQCLWVVSNENHYYIHDYFPLCIYRYMWFLFPFILLTSVASFLLKIKSHQTFDLYQKMTVGDFEGNGQSWYDEISKRRN